MTLTTEQLRARAESLGLNFFIERRAGIWVKEWINNGCTSATAEEVLLWSMLANREAQPVQVTDSMALDFHRALTDGDIGKSELEEIKFGLRAALCNVTAPPAPAVNAAPDFEAWFVEKYKQPERLMKNGDGAYKFSGVQMAFSAWVDGRAAMLAAAPEGGNG
ncbi:hypothetical protein [Serratia marcescens]|uniref:hypothetical protein n=1 Tax=Serratia marcescens TaxID=615 RepID=UPI0009513F61|nr:hypothetical protein [Serratia marcescens]